MFLEISQNSQENSCARVSFCLRPATLLKKRLWQEYFSVNFAKFLRTHLDDLQVFVGHSYRTIYVYLGVKKGKLVWESLFNAVNLAEWMSIYSQSIAQWFFLQIRDLKTLRIQLREEQESVCVCVCVCVGGGGGGEGWGMGVLIQWNCDMVLGYMCC